MNDKQINAYIHFKTSLGDKSKKSYERNLKRFKKEYQMLTADNIKLYIQDVAPNTSQTYLAIIKDFSCFLYEDNRFKLSELEYKRIKQLKKHTGDRIKQPYKISRRSYEHILNRLSKRPLFAGAWFLAWNYGIRPQEIVSLKIKDVDFQNMELIIRGLLKTDKSQREIPIAPHQVPMLRIMIGGRNRGYLFVKKVNYGDKIKLEPYTPEYLSGEFSRFVGQYLSDIKPRFSLYGGRYSTAYRMNDKKMSLSDMAVIMGHSSFQMTLRYIPMHKKDAKASFRKAMC